MADNEENYYGVLGSLKVKEMQYKDLVFECKSEITKAF